MNKQLGFLLIAVLFNGSQTAVICPPATVYSPCSCDEYKGNSATIELNCGGKNVDDTRMSAILDALFTTGGASPVASLNLWTNKLTRVPSQLPRFTQLVSVDLNSNTIRSLPTGAFKFTSSLIDLYLESNLLAIVEPDAFQGDYGSKTIVWMSSNSLTRFESSAFQSLLETLLAKGSGNAFINIFNSKLSKTINIADSNLISINRCHRLRN